MRKRLRALLVGLRHRPSLGGDEREPAPVGGRDLAAARLLAEHRRALLGGLIFVDDGDERPHPDDLLAQLVVVGAGAGRRDRQSYQQQSAHRRPP